MTRHSPPVVLQWGQAVAAASLRLQEAGMSGEDAFDAALAACRAPGSDAPPPRRARCGLIQRILALLAESEPMTTTEIAAVLDVPVSAVQMSLSNRGHFDLGLARGEVAPGMLVTTGKRKSGKAWAYLWWVTR